MHVQSYGKSYNKGMIGGDDMGDATQHMNVAVQNELDECYCGDYRKNHIDGTGRCVVCAIADVGILRCMEFRLFRNYTEFLPRYENE
jgi:hypothetical protein